MSLRDAAQQALKMLKRGVSFKPGWVPDCEDAIAALEAALAEPQPEPVALTFAGLTVRELRIPAGMTVRIDRDALIVEPQRDPNDPILVEPNHDPSHAPYVALAEPQPQPEPMALQKVRYEIASGETRGEMAAHCREGDLYRIGDAILVWANEGDIIALGQRIERAHNIGGDK